MNVKLIRENPKIAQDIQKIYENKRQRDLEFEVKNQVFLRLTPWKSVLCFGRNGKLSHRYIGLYVIVERVRPATYRL